MAWAFFALLAANAASPRILYETGFEPAQGFDLELTLVGQDGWVGDGSGGNGLVTDFFPNQGQHAFIGFGAPTGNEDFLNVWKPVNYQPGTTNPPIVRFTVLMSIEDSSSTTNRDDFRWSVYNSAGDRLFTLDFDNDALGINYLLDDNAFVSTGKNFTNAVPYQLEVVIDFEENRWSAYLDGTPLAVDARITTRNANLNFGDVDAVWAVRVPGKAGDNFMVFDNFRITAEERAANPPPRLEPLGFLRPGEFLLRCFGVTGANYILEATPDFRTWTPIKTNSMPADGHFDHLDTGGPGPRFYRMVER